MKPMKSQHMDESKIVLHLPVTGQPKFDGIRMIVRNGQGLSNSLKVLPNGFLQEWVDFHAHKLEGCDGEIIVGDPTSETVFNNTSGPVRKHWEEFDFTYYVFDKHNSDKTFKERHLELTSDEFLRGVDRVRIVGYEELKNLKEIYAYENFRLVQGYEGVMLRGNNAKYKFGRSYANGGEMCKLKRFLDTEAKVIGFQELLSNQNEATKNEMGNTARSSHKENKVPMNTLGALIVEGIYADGTPYTVNVGTFKGLTASDKKRIWDNQDDYMGETIKFKYFPVGTQEAPRHPVFLGWRMKEDM